MKRKSFTDEEDVYLDYLYSLGNGLNSKAIEMFNEKFNSNRTEGSLSSRATRLGLAKKYPSKYSVYNKQIYQDYDWYYDMFVNKGLDHEDMAKEIGVTKRVIEKWGQEKHHITIDVRRKEKQLSKIQYDLINGSLLGDGHICKTNHFFVVSHADNQKDYLFYKHNIMKDLCSMTPTRFEPTEKKFGDKICLSRPYYRFNTRVYDAYNEFVGKTKIDLIKDLNEFSFSIWMLDDGYCTDKRYWTLCAPFDEDTVQVLNECLKNKFGINPRQRKDARYFGFNAVDSKTISDIILRNIPNDLDIIKYKLLEDVQAN